MTSPLRIFSRKIGSLQDRPKPGGCDVDVSISRDKLRARIGSPCRIRDVSGLLLAAE